jgi:hypothetical protein
MRKGFLFVAGFVLAFAVMRTEAQTRVHDEVPHYEVGGHLFSFNGHDFGLGWGIGGRFTYNINKYVSLDNEVDSFLADDGTSYATQALFGVKAGKRIKKFGVFAKARPGFQTNFIVNRRRQPRFVMDLGAVAEYYPNRHLVLRVDASDVVLPFGNNLVGSGAFAQRLGTTHNFQFSLGVGVRF